MALISSTISFSIFLIFLATLLQSSLSYASTTQDPSLIASHRSLLAAQRNAQQQIPNCSGMVARSQCSQNPKCRWCKSEALDDMCFSKIEAWRLPQQVFVCD